LLAWIWGVRLLFEFVKKLLLFVLFSVVYSELFNTLLPVSLILETVGDDNQANFNRHFELYKSVTIGSAANGNEVLLVH
jgi:hypothetical protein